MEYHVGIVIKRVSLNVTFLVFLLVSCKLVAEGTSTEAALRELFLAHSELENGLHEQSLERVNAVLNSDLGSNNEANAEVLIRSAMILRDLGKVSDFTDSLRKAYSLNPQVPLREMAVSMLVEHAVETKNEPMLEDLLVFTEKDSVCQVVVKEGDIRRRFIEQPDGESVEAYRNLVWEYPNSHYLEQKVREARSLAHESGDHRLALEFVQLAAENFPDLTEDTVFQLNMAATQWQAEEFPSAIDTASTLVEEHGEEFSGVHNALWILAISNQSLLNYEKAEIYLDLLVDKLDTYQGSVDFAEQANIIRGEISHQRKHDMGLDDLLANYLNEEYEYLNGDQVGDEAPNDSTVAGFAEASDVSTAEVTDSTRQSSGFYQLSVMIGFGLLLVGSIGYYAIRVRKR